MWPFRKSRKSLIEDLAHSTSETLISYMRMAETQEELDGLWAEWNEIPLNLLAPYENLTAISVYRNKSEEIYSELWYEAMLELGVELGSATEIIEESTKDD